MSKPDEGAIDLPGHFSQVQLAGLKELVDHHKEGGSVIQFDASALERIDGAAVQFLLSVSKTQAGGDAAALVINANEVLISALSDMGVSDRITTSPPE
jgi:ABC-type transporter Mla MlaB component